MVRQPREIWPYWKQLWQSWAFLIIWTHSSKVFLSKFWHFIKTWFLLQAWQARIFAFKCTLPEPHLDWLPCLPDAVPWLMSVVIQVNNGSLDFKLGFGLVPLYLLSDVMFIMLPNTALFAALAFAAMNAEMSLMFGLLPDCWIESATSTNLVRRWNGNLCTILQRLSMLLISSRWPIDSRVCSQFFSLSANSSSPERSDGFI